MISYLIIDDEHIAHDIIKGYCDLLPNMQLMKNCYDALEAFDYLSKNKVDLIFLDLNMPVLKGFEFLKILQNPPKVIVTTAYQEFALEGYEYNISDYLLKPFGFERFLKAVNKAIGSVNQKVVTNEKSEGSNRIFVQSNKKHIQLETENILYIEATGNYTKIITTTETITIREKFSTFLEQLPKNDFVQVHKSFAVAPKQINSIEGNIIFISNYQIPIGKMFKINILKLLR
ncbi:MULTISPECIES: LytR/AlgR family response regulator transcription factor [Epilithonimonas]|uniref:Transcriptional regulator n=2 Tax=Epilithonimonas TaxID=2782229 RepID=A0A085BKP9_9FLAO|nr:MULTISPECIES: response regulator transcription factor [Epilithonimonas]KFC18623.1 transcriptional regulator [Epilithonimonas lactis]KFC23044.1 transcriptional regulator [Epilithonimonas lactis]REC66960.1 DNA-binding response regulator [Epilithonimonas hispanica]SEQ66243.1 two component transcriptional regulator, LytTR family [Epilithonimonas lactis]